jgi:hypothetical protein
MPRGTVTNVHLQSEDVSDVVAYSKAASAVIGAFGGALPAGVSLAKTVSDSGASSTVYYVSGTNTLIPGTAYIASAFVQYQAGSGWFFFGGQDGTSLAGRYFNAQTGAIGNTGGAYMPQVDDRFGNGWKRVSMGFVATPLAAADATIYLGTADGTLSYTANGQSIAVTGLQVEIAQPGQLSPSPYVASGATPGVGPRDYRENLALSSEDTTAWTIDGVSPSVVGGVVTLTENGANAPHRIYQAINPLVTGPMVIAFDAEYTGSRRYVVGYWSGGAQATFDLVTGQVTNTAFITSAKAYPTSVPNRWRCLMQVTNVSAVSTNFQIMLNATSGAFASYPGDGVSGLRVTRMQVARTNQMPDYVKTTSGIWCPSGAPRAQSL